MDEYHFQELLESLREAMAMMRGERKPARCFRVRLDNIKKVRKKLGMSQPEFAQLLGISVKTLQAWEAQRLQPSRDMALSLLQIAQQYPEVLMEIWQEVSV